MTCSKTHIVTYESHTQVFFSSFVCSLSWQMLWSSQSLRTTATYRERRKPSVVKEIRVRNSVDVAGNREHSAGLWWNILGAFSCSKPHKILGGDVRLPTGDGRLSLTVFGCKYKYYCLQQSPDQVLCIIKESEWRTQYRNHKVKEIKFSLCLPGMFPEIELHGNKSSKQSSGLLLQQREIS